jgi:hypothetical protein
VDSIIIAQNFPSLLETEQARSLGREFGAGFARFRRRYPNLIVLSVSDTSVRGTVDLNIAEE